MNTISKTENKILMANAREALHGNWGTPVLFCALVMVVELLEMIPVIGGLIGLLIFGPLSVAWLRLGLMLVRKKKVNLERFKDACKKIGEPDFLFKGHV